MYLNPLYDQKTGLGQPTQFEKKFKTRRKALFDGSNESQNVTGYENT